MKELLKEIETVCRDRGDSTKRAAPMTMIMLIKLHENIEKCVATNPLYLEEAFHVMAACDVCFYLWLRINEFLS